MLPLKSGTEDVMPGNNEEATNNETDTVAMTFNAYQTSTQAKLAQYHHQSLWLPPPLNLLNTINNNQLDSFPGLKKDLLKSLPPSTEKYKGHMHRNIKFIRSIRSTTTYLQDARLDVQDMNPFARIMCYTRDGYLLICSIS